MKKLNIFTLSLLMLSLAVGCEQSSGNENLDLNLALGKLTDGVCTPKEVPLPSNMETIDIDPSCDLSPYSEIASQVGIDTDAVDLSKMQAQVLHSEDCLQVTTPDSLQFVVGAALETDEEGERFAKDFRLPLPANKAQTEAKEEDESENNNAAMSASANVFEVNDTNKEPVKEETDTNDTDAQLAVSLEPGMTLLVGKVITFRGEKVLKLVNIATIQQEDSGLTYIETLTKKAQNYVSNHLQIDGPGVYGIYAMRQEMALVSGVMKIKNLPANQIMVEASTSPFVSFSNMQGKYSLAMTLGESAILAYDLATAAHAEKLLTVVRPDAINPKTNQSPENGLNESAIPELSQLNYHGADLSLTHSKALLMLNRSPNLDFETGSIENWLPQGDITVTDREIKKLFPDSKERHYGIISTGNAALNKRQSSLAREMTVPEETSTLHIEYNFLTQEFPQYVESNSSDLFVVSLVGNLGVLHSESVATDAELWQPAEIQLGAVSNNPNMAGQTKPFTGQTGSRTLTFDLNRCAGETVHLVMTLSDIGDSKHDSAIVVNRVWFE